MWRSSLQIIICLLSKRHQLPRLCPQRSHEGHSEVDICSVKDAQSDVVIVSLTQGWLTLRWKERAISREAFRLSTLEILGPLTHDGAGFRPPFGQIWRAMSIEDMARFSCAK